MRSNCAATARQAKPREMSALLAPNGIALAAQTCQHIMEPPLPSYLCMLAPTPPPPTLLIAMQRERPFEYAATSFSVRPWPMRIRPVVIVIALVAAVVASAAAAVASAVVVAPSYC